MTNKNPGCNKCVYYSALIYPSSVSGDHALNDHCQCPHTMTITSSYWGDRDVLGDPSEINKDRDCEYFTEGK